jgi:hypothetical protein
MSVTKSLSFTSVPKVKNDPSRARRERLIERLREQKELVSNPSIVRTTQRIVRKDGAKTIVEIQQKVRPWWRSDEKGQIVFFIRIGWRLLEFEKGKAGVVVGAKEKLSTVIDLLISAISKGELDGVLEANSQRVVRPRKAA